MVKAHVLQKLVAEILFNKVFVGAIIEMPIIFPFLEYGIIESWIFTRNKLSKRNYKNKLLKRNYKCNLEFAIKKIAKKYLRQLLIVGLACFLLNSEA